MGYQHREDEPGSIHHVWNRGLRRKEIYRTDRDRHRFVDDLASASLATETDVIAYCEMGNHFHLVVISRAGRLSDMMQRLASSYARGYNTAHGFDGPLFRGRYQANRIATDEQLLATVRYVDRNPLELGIRIDDYPWSSYPVYLGRRSSDLVRTDLVLELAGGRTSYRRFVEAPLPSDRFTISDGVRSIGPAPRETPDLALVLSVVDTCGRTGDSRWIKRSCALVLTVDVLGIDAERVAAHLGVTTIGALRTALSRARRRLSHDDEFADYVRSCSDALTTGRLRPAV